LKIGHSIAYELTWNCVDVVVKEAVSTSASASTSSTRGPYPPIRFTVS